MNEMIDTITRPSNRMNLVVSLLLAMFVVFKFKIPDNMAVAVNSVYGHMLIVATTFYIFTQSNAVVAVLFMIAAYELLNRASDTSMYTISQYIPSENKKLNMMESVNGFPATLEESVIDGAIPLASHDSTVDGTNYQPRLAACNGAEL